MKAGERLSELALVERLGVSRTPIRTAMMRLEQEGLTHPIPTGGFAVSAFSEQDIHAAIEIRGTLEGLAARLAGERRLVAADLIGLKNCLAALDELVLVHGVTSDNFSHYVELNERFHQLVIDLADSAVLKRQIARAVVASVRVGVRLRQRAGEPAGNSHPFHRRAGSSPLHRSRDRGRRRRARGIPDARTRAACTSQPGACAAQHQDSPPRAGIAPHSISRPKLLYKFFPLQRKQHRRNAK